VHDLFSVFYGVPGGSALQCGVCPQYKQWRGFAILMFIDTDQNHLQIAITAGSTFSPKTVGNVHTTGFSMAAMSYALGPASGVWPHPSHFLTLHVRRT